MTIVLWVVGGTLYTAIVFAIGWKVGCVVDRARRFAAFVELYKPCALKPVTINQPLIIDDGQETVH